MRSWVRNVLRVGVTGTLLASALTACSSSGGPPTLTWYYNPDNGGQIQLAAECTAAAHGQYTIATHQLPNDASDQRQQLVTRLAAKDSSISIMSLDPVFVAEFAEAGFLADVPAQYQSEFTADIVKPAVQASTWKGKLVAAPFWANTQLLWYRKSIAQQAGLDMSQPVTWQQVIDAAHKAGKTVGVQANLYEGYTVWINALIAGAGGQIVDNPGAIAKNLKLGLDSAAGLAAVKIIQQVVQQGVGGPSLSTNTESQALALFEAPSSSGFLVNWPYVWAAMGPGGDKVSFRDSDVGWAMYPETVAGQPSRPPFGGIELGVGAYTAHKDFAFDAVNCIRSEKHQLEYMINTGNPAANTKVYDDSTPVQVADSSGKQTAHTVQGDFPMAQLIQQSLQNAAPRPQSQYYGDLSTALQESFSPPSSVNTGTPAAAQKFILEVLKGERLL